MDQDIGDCAPDGSRYRHFHFHGFEYDDSVARLYWVADLDEVADYFPGHLGWHRRAIASFGCRRGGNRHICRLLLRQADLEAATVNGGRVAVNGHGIATAIDGDCIVRWTVGRGLFFFLFFDLAHADFAFSLEEGEALVLAGGDDKNVFVRLFKASFSQLFAGWFDALVWVGVVAFERLLSRWL